MSTLEQTIRETIPMARYMDFEVTSLEALRMETSAPLAPNINIHGTAFAGALYTLGALTAWGMLQSRLPDGAVLVMMEGNIRYRRPVTGALLAACALDSTETEVFLSKLDEERKARMTVHVLIGDPTKPAATFTGLMHASIPAK
ncbi:MAG: YiiD C-terminal domain-containing protein [Gammaproteobacteria bacterium]